MFARRRSLELVLLVGLALAGPMLPESGRAGLPAPIVERWRHEFAGSQRHTFGPPLAVQLTDDDGDGSIGEGDCPDLVVVIAAGNDAPGLLHAVDGQTGHPLFVVEEEVSDRHGVAAGDVDGDGVVELIVSDDSHYHVLDHLGVPIWSGEWPSVRERPTYVGHGLADFDHDGVVEVYRGNEVVSLDGSWSWAGGDDHQWLVGQPHVAELDPDSPGLELLFAGVLHAADGTVLWSMASTLVSTSGLGDLDGDGDGEVVMLSRISDRRSYELKALDHRGVTLGSLDIGSSRPHEPTIVDLDGDGAAEVVLPADDRLRAYRWAGDAFVQLWQQPMRDSSCCVAPVVFDLDGDGRPEVLHRDQDQWWILEGSTGEILHSQPSRSVTVWDSVIVSDLDCDGDAELVVTEHEQPQVRLVVHEAPGSTSPRMIWNQADHHVTNVEADGRIPRVETAPWELGDDWHSQAIVTPSDEACRHLGVETLTDVLACQGEEVVLDASAVTIEGCGSEMTYEWWLDDELIGTGPVLTLTPETSMRVTLRPSCQGLTCCGSIQVAIWLEQEDWQGVTVIESSCEQGIELTWDAVEFPVGVGGTFQLYRSTGDTASCEDALSRPPVADLPWYFRQWEDTDTTVGEDHVYVVEAVEADGHCGAAPRLCVGPIVDRFHAVPEPGAVLRCADAPVRLEASGWPPPGCDASFEWTVSGETEVLGRGPFLDVTPDVDTDYVVELTCADDCSWTRAFSVRVGEGPGDFIASVADLDPCRPGLRLSWTAAPFSDPARGGVYHVYRSVGPDASGEDALSREPIVSHLASTSWIDASTALGERHVHVVVAEDAIPAVGDCPTGPSGGALRESNATDVVDATAPEEDEVEPVWATLRARHAGEEVTFHWAAARELNEGEEFVLLKAVDHPTMTFRAVRGLEPDGREHTETDTSSPRQFFDLRVRHCGVLSVDEYPPTF
ncbi:MAG: FG-GAP-like repeat-containing protein [Acidobacteriota bacterium]